MKRHYKSAIILWLLLDAKEYGFAKYFLCRIKRLESLIRVDEFRSWLQGKALNSMPIKDCISRCKKVEKALGTDLDLEFAKDNGESLIETLTYSAQDQRNNKKVPGGFDFRPNANVRLRLADLKSAVKKHITFCESQ